MGKISDIIKKFIYGVFNKAVKSDQEFFSKPKALILLRTASLAILNPLLNQLKSLIQKKAVSLLDKKFSKDFTDDDVLEYVKNDRLLRRVTKFASNDLDNTLVSEIVLECEDPDYFQTSPLLDQLEGDDFLKIAQQQSDFDSKIKKFDLSQLNETLNKIKGTLPWVFMVYSIILKVKEFLNQNDHPSPYRGKYLQRQLRLVAAILQEQKQKMQNLKPNLEEEKAALQNLKTESKEGIKEIGQQIDVMIASLKSLDAIIVGSLLAASVYIANRKKYQKSSTEAFSENVGSLLCDVQIETPDVSVISKPFEISLDCPVDPDNVAVVHEPIELKLDVTRLENCDLEPAAEELVIDEKDSNEIATKAIIDNQSSKNFNILVTKDQMVTTRTPLGTLGGSRIYSPVDGIVAKILNNQIYLDDINDPESTYLEELMQKSQDLYQELNDTKYFLKDYYVNSMFPIMLKSSPLIDASISAAERLKILFSKGGITERWGVAQKQLENVKKSYDKNIQKITGEDNVKKKANNEELYKIKEEVDKEDDKFYGQLKIIYSTAINQSEVTLPKESEFALLEYYFDLYGQLMANFDQSKTLIPFRDEIYKFMVERYFVDKWDEKKLAGRINDYCQKLAKGTFFHVTPDFFKEMNNRYKSNNQVSDVEAYVISLGKKNKNMSETDKTSLIKRIMFMFNFSLQIKQMIENKYETKLNKYQATEKEGNYIQNFCNILWKRYDEIPKEIDQVMKELDDLGNSFTTYSIIDIDNDKYRFYGIGKERTCPKPEDDDFTASEYGFGDMKYWLKYCAIATLIGITNPAQSWSTGLPPPIGPIPFPVVYIPIKAFALNWGFIVLGISITGIYPFPWVLFGNLSSEHHVPVADPATIIRKNVEALKKPLTKGLKEFKQVTLKGYLDKTKAEIDNLTVELDDVSKRKREHKENKPKRDRTLEDSEVIYVKQLAAWTEQNLILTERIATIKLNRFTLETKYKIVYDAYSGMPVKDFPDPTIKAIQKSEEAINKQFEKLDQMIAKIDPMLAPLPISTKPNSASFALTVKNPKPVILIKDELNDNINTGVLNPIVEKFKIKSDDFMSKNFNNKMQNSVVNWKKYKLALKAAMPTIVTKDPFPKYQNLKLTNLPWIAFLFKDFTPTGAKTYGFPGFSPYPVG